MTDGQRRQLSCVSTAIRARVHHLHHYTGQIANLYEKLGGPEIGQP